MAVVRTGKAPHQIRDIGPAAAAVDGLAAAGRLSVEHLLTGAGTVAGCGPVERIHPTPPPTPRTEDPVVDPAEPCSTCLHAPVCRLRLMLTDLGALEPVQVIDKGLRVVATGYRVECDHHLAAAPALMTGSLTTTTPVVVTMAAPGRSAAEMAQASRQRGANARRKLAQQRATDDQVIDALRRSEGDKTMAGRACGITGTAIASRVANLRAHGTLPVDVELLLAKRARKAGAA